MKKPSLSSRQIFLWINLIVAIDGVCYSQNIGLSDSLEYQLQFELFDKAVGIENTEVINGPKHVLPFPGSGTHPFYNSSIGAKGNLTYAGQPYFNLTLLFDTYSDELVVQPLLSSGTRELLVLNKDKVESFGIYGHRFRNYQGAQAKELGIGSGYYDVLYESTVFTIMAKRQKHTKVEMGLVQFEAEDKLLFARPGRKATPFRGMKGFYQVLNDKDSKAELRAFVKERNLRIMKSDPDLIEAARYCDAILRRKK